MPSVVLETSVLEICQMSARRITVCCTIMNGTFFFSLWNCFFSACLLLISLCSRSDNLLAHHSFLKHYTAAYSYTLRAPLVQSLFTYLSLVLFLKIQNDNFHRTIFKLICEVYGGWSSFWLLLRYVRFRCNPTTFVLI